MLSEAGHNRQAALLRSPADDGSIVNACLVVALALFAVLSSGCSPRRTRQFVVADHGSESVQVDGWSIEPPRVVAFKDAAKLDNIPDTTMFWITIRAKHPISNLGSPNTDLIIDSALVTFLSSGKKHWRLPTRAAAFGLPEWEYRHKVFDFYGGSGLVIPMSVDSIMLEFDAVLTGKPDSSISVQPVRFVMVRDEDSANLPFFIR